MFKRILRAIQPPRTFVGIVLSPSSIKLLALVQKNHSYQIAAYAVSTLPMGAIINNEIHDVAVVSASLARLVQEADVATKNAAIAITDTLVIQGILKLDALFSDAEIELQVYYAIQQYISYPLEEARLDFIKHGKEVAFAAVHVNVINQYQTTVSQAGLTIKIVDVTTYAIVKACLLLMPELFAPILMIDKHQYTALTHPAGYAIDLVMAMRCAVYIDPKVINTNLVSFLCAYGLALRGFD